ncbi:putative retrotransposon hot spot protein 4 (RHS4) [Trypanosoma vivax]|nr:putative retrotransposon hot spot protein 4 (RHS4) [Trypanosoma vivax]
MFSVFRHSLRLAGVRHARVSAHVWTNQLRLYHRTLPFLCPAASGSTTWTLDSRVRDVLLDGARPPDNVMLLSECLERVRHRGTDIDGNVRMDVVIQRPERFIPDADLREMILSLPECQAYALVYRAVPLLRRKGITGLLQWGGADENTDAKRAVRDELADDGLWNTVCSLLDIAFNAAKGGGASERSESEAGKVIPAAFESVLNATWSYVESGDAAMPLGMRVVDGRPKSVWSDAEVNRTPDPWQTGNVNEEHDDGLELLVLTSKKGWPFTKFQTEEESDVFVRREVMRVWHIVRRELAGWPDDDRKFNPRPYVLVGTPGIGKSFDCGSYLLYELLHYDAAKVPVVAYFVDGSAYIFHKTGAMAGRVVFYKKADDALTVMWDMENERHEALVKRKEAEGVKDAEKDCRAKCGFIIFDVSGKCQPENSLSTTRWGCVVLSSPKVSNFKEWKKQKRAFYIFINCYTMLEMKAFFVRREWCRCRTCETYQACGAEIEQRWSVVKQRIAEVGPMLRYVFDDKEYNERCRDVSVALSNINDVDMARYMRILLYKIPWLEDGTTHKIIKLVRAASDPVEDCLNFPASEVIGARLNTLVVNYFFGKSYLAKALEMPGLTADVLEKFGSCAFMYESVVDKVVEKMKCLPSALCSHASGSVLSRLRAAARYAQHHQVIAFKIGDQRGGVSLEARDLRTGVLYIPDLVNFPVLDAFYFVDAPPQDAAAVGRAGARGACANWTIVCLQMTRKDNHDTTTGAVVGFMARMREWIRDWDVVKDRLSWEMIYVQHQDAKAMSRRQVCAMAAGEVREEHRDAHAFWNRVEQYQAQMDNDLLAAVMLAAGRQTADAVPQVATASSAGQWQKALQVVVETKEAKKATKTIKAKKAKKTIKAKKSDEPKEIKF